MKIEKEIFQKYRVEFNKLREYGFIENNGKYIYTKNFLNDNFKCIVIIDKQSKIEGKVIDLDTNLEYTNIRLKISGSYINMVKNSYKKILLDIRNNCFKENFFIYSFSNLVCDYIYNKYGNKPEFLWDNSLSGVFRNKNNHKWYAIIMNVKEFNGKRNVEIINVKINQIDKNQLLKEEGIFEAYHMNKKQWISIILDGSIKIDRIYKLIDDSYKLIERKK